MTLERLRRLAVGFVGVTAVLMPAAARAGTDRTSPAAGSFVEDPTGGDDNSFVYQLRGVADGIRLSFDREAFLPFSPIVDLKLATSAATIDSTPVTNVHSTVADPGLLGSLGSALPVLGFPAGLVPAWPLSADASYPSGPADAVSGFGTDQSVPTDPGLLHGESHAELDHGTGRARAGGAALSGLFDIRGMASSVDVKREGTRLVGRAQATLTGVSLLDGLIRFESLASLVTIDWPSPAEKAAVTRQLEAAGLTVAGLPVPVPKDTQSNLGTTMNTALRTIAGERFSVAFEPKSTEVAGGVKVSALRFFVDGKVLPAVPPFLGQEIDRFYVDLAVSALSYQGESFDQIGLDPLPSLGEGLTNPVVGEPTPKPGFGNSAASVDSGGAESGFDGTAGAGFGSGALDGASQIGSSPPGLPPAAPDPTAGQTTASAAPSSYVPAVAQGDLIGTIARRLDLLRFMIGPLILAVPGLVLYGRFVVAPAASPMASELRRW
ncbi:MAG: choice-of-anchor P family protein [Actinomycetota bacterium]